MDVCVEFCWHRESSRSCGKRAGTTAAAAQPTCHQFAGMPKLRNFYVCCFLYSVLFVYYTRISFCQRV